MRKGDIVSLKIHTLKKFVLSAYSEESWQHTQNIEEKDIPTEFVISKTTPGQFCGGRDAALEFENIPGIFNEKYFEVVLEAGEPDVDQLMEETKQIQPLITSQWGIII